MNSKKIHTISELRSVLGHFRENNDQIALVPTMGNLHAGHIALVKAAQKACNRVVVSIFVNPLQFAPGEDFESYPRTLNEDMAKLTDAGVDVVFAPTASEMYPHGNLQQCVIHVPAFEGKACAVSRPHFFTGVATVVMKLLNIVQPTQAFFGEKDFQQLRVIETLVQDFCLPIDIQAVPTMREADGLAMSSRNAYLTAEEREIAPHLYACLQHAVTQCQQGETDFQRLQTEITEALTAVGFRVDYVTICSRRFLEPASAADTDCVILAAAFLGRARLIDNIQFQL